jgi:predicted HAD superfamily phosphohydrolase YqeG
MSDTIIVDFDGTIAEWGEYPEPGPPCPGVKEALQAIKDQGLIVAVLSARTSDQMSKHPIDKEMEKRRIEEYLKEHEIPYDVVLKNDKPVARFYIDDRAIEYRGDWEDVLRKVEEYEE